MGRAKLTLELIKKEKYRNSTFMSRKTSMKKKLYELSTLCGVKAMMIIYGPKQNPKQDRPIQPDIWPEDRVEVLELINKYKVQPTDECEKRTFSLFKFFDERNKRAQAALTKLRESNVQAKYPLWDKRFDNLSAEKLNRIATFLETKLGHAKKYKIMQENKRNHNAYYLQQQQKILPKKNSRGFEGSNQLNKVHITSASRGPIYNSYNSHLPVPLQMQVPMPMPLQQYMPNLDQCTMQRALNFNNTYVGGSSNFIYVTPVPKAEPNMAYNDPMAGMAQSISSLNNLMTAPRMNYFSDSMQSMTHSYTDGVMQPIPQNYAEYPARSTAAAVSPCPKYHEGYYKYRD